MLPVAAALGGMVVPAAIYAALNHAGPAARGWGIPMATDVAFALGVMAMLGRRVPVSAKILLTAVAIVDGTAPLLRLQTALLPLSTLIVLPIFALFNAGTSLSGNPMAAFGNPIGAALGGIGFTTALFVNSLAFFGPNLPLRDVAMIGVLSASLLSAVAGWLILRRAHAGAE